MAQSCDQAINLDSGQLATLAGLGTLCNLDFNLFTIIQIFGRDTKPTRCDLLDRA